MTSYRLAGRTVAITGSTGGLGTALAQALRDRGANLALLDLNTDAVEQQAQRLGGPSVARAWTANVRAIDTLHTAMDAAADHFGRLDVAIANAGIDTMAPMATLELPLLHDHRLETAVPVAGHIDLHRPDLGEHCLRSGSVTGIGPIATGRVVPVIARVFGQFGLQRGLEHLLGPSREQTTRTGQINPLGPGTVH
jgi:NAD(P)-dependent dehydrogenase (short-subunit alcohol dehydrogenase family)